MQTRQISIQCTSESLIIEELGESKEVVLIQRTSESLVIEEFRVSKCSHFDTTH